jgi:hypothetical protein
MIKRVFFLSIVSFLLGNALSIGLRGNSDSGTAIIGCDSPFGNPCGALQNCIADRTLASGFRCEANTEVELCNVFCEEGSTCVRDVQSRKFECRCDYGFQKPDPYFDCTMINGFQAKA